MTNATFNSWVDLAIKSVNIMAFIIYVRYIVRMSRENENCGKATCMKITLFITSAIIIVQMILVILNFTIDCIQTDCYNESSGPEEIASLIYFNGYILLTLFLLIFVLVAVMMPTCIVFTDININAVILIKPGPAYILILLVVGFLVYNISAVLQYTAYHNSGDEINYKWVSCNTLQIITEFFLIRSLFSYTIDTFRAALLWSTSCILLISVYLYSSIIYFTECHNGSCYNTNMDYIPIVITQHFITVCLCAFVVYILIKICRKVVTTVEKSTKSINTTEGYESLIFFEDENERV